ncbi:BamA/TamA family outer membrane protein [Ferrimonas balearica]|uniref:BamA/TamA family outer membrane protein n=1 Tax=Ferrimonas balearica TaxID=44012 RepID=UPI001C990E26|nr:BamA/TamA family outer membrane protein [Ferrimonas balearica]MBY5991461.1 outer membrane protein assembly factor [Ferrimonas balearica]
MNRVPHILFLALLLALSAPLSADDAGVEIFEPTPPVDSKDSVVIPIVGAMDSTGMIAGAVASVTGVGQPHAQLVGFGAYSVNDSYITFLGYYNYALSERWTLDASALQAEFTDSTFYLDQMFANPVGGQMDTALDASYLQRDLYLTFRYLLGQDEEAASRLQLSSGLPVAPERIARTVVEFEPFYQTRDLRTAQSDNIEGKTYGLSATLDRDTRDFWPSPSRGYHSYAKVLRDWGGSERAAYTRWEAQYTHYLDLGQTAWARQQTLALTGYLSDIPTWDKASPWRQPDWFAQSVLGGSERLRGFGNDRFNDRSALFYGVEYRTIPQWQPQSRIPFFNRYDFPWWQFALFAELGKVESRFDLGDLHSEMEWSAGFGLRFFIERMVARADFGFSGEESLFHFTVNQAF